jgi:hypothetical protein
MRFMQTSSAHLLIADLNRNLGAKGVSVYDGFCQSAGCSGAVDGASG